MDIPDSPPPSHHANDSATAFQNPWAVKSLLASKQILSQFPIALAKRVDELRTHRRPIEVVKPDFGVATADEGVIKATWVGHAVSIYSIFTLLKHYINTSMLTSHRVSWSNCRKPTLSSPSAYYLIPFGLTAHRPTSMPAPGGGYLHLANWKSFRTFSLLSRATISKFHCCI